MAEIGFVIADNLSESDNTAKDIRILDNLGGEGTSGNFQLFSGNLRRESVLVKNQGFTQNSNNTVYTTLIDEGFIAFSNDTKVTLLDENDVIIDLGNIVNSNGRNTFQIQDENDNLISIPTSKIVRSDSITFTNITNLKRTRIETIVDLDQEGNFLATENSGEQDIFGSLNINSQYSVIDAGLSNYYFKLSRLPLSYQNTAFPQNINIDGYIRIVNDSSRPRSNTSPGLFIINREDDSVTRAFEDRNIAWSENSSGAIVTAANTTVNTLTLTNPSIKNLRTIANSGPVINATHKLPVEIVDDDGNSEIYFLLLLLD